MDPIIKRNLKIQKSTIKELSEILEIQKISYKKEAERYNDFNIPPLTQTIDEIEKEFESSIFLSAIYDNKIIGSVRGRKIENGCEIGRLMVLPEYQRNGIGRKLLKAIEKELYEMFPGTSRFELFTGELSFDNINLYESEGYQKFKYEAFDEDKRIVFLEKLLS